MQWLILLDQISRRRNAAPFKTPKACNIASNIHPPLDHPKISHDLSNLDPVNNNPRYIDVRWRCSSVTASRIEPLFGIPVVERPRRDNDETCKGGARKSDPEHQVNVLLDVTDDESDDLLRTN